MDDLLAHFFQHRLGYRESLVVAAAHERKRRALRAAGAAGDRRIDRSRAMFRREHMGLFGAFNVDRRAVDDKRAFAHGRQHFLPDRKHMLAGRQHCDDDFGALDGSDRALGDGCAIRFGLIARGGHEIEGNDLVASLDEISGCTSSIRGGDHLGLRSLSMTAARTPSRKSSLRKTSSAARYSRTRHSSSEAALRASRSNFSVTTMPRGDFSFNTLSVDCANSESSRERLAKTSCIRSWANQWSIEACWAAIGPALSPVAKPR